MSYFPIWLFCFVLFLPTLSWAVDYHFDGRFRWDSRYVTDPPNGFKDFDHAFELRLGGNGQFIHREDWALDYEILVDTRYVDGPSEQARFVQDFDVETFRGWLRLEKGKWRVRGGRQQILFGAGMLFRPLGFFDNRLISSVFPQTVGVDSLRFSYFLSDTATLQGWLVPAKLNDRILIGSRWEGLIAGLETGLVIQYSPVTDLDVLPNSDLELVQVGYHFKGEREIGFWGEGRFDFEKKPGSNAFRTEAVIGLDYTIDFGEGLHILFEYFLSAKGREFADRTLQVGTTIYQFGLQLDQPIGIATIWRLFGFYDLRDGSFQVTPQIEYALTEQTFLYLQGNLGGDVKGEENLGRLFRKGPVFTGTESSIGFTLIVFF